MKTPITCPVCEDSACETKSLQCGTSHAERKVTASCTPEVGSPVFISQKEFIASLARGDGKMDQGAPTRYRATRFSYPVAHNGMPFSSLAEARRHWHFVKNDLRL